jgi:hypothetical protein
MRVLPGFPGFAGLGMGAGAREETLPLTGERDDGWGLKL